MLKRKANIKTSRQDIGLLRRLGKNNVRRGGALLRVITAFAAILAFTASLAVAETFSTPSAQQDTTASSAQQDTSNDMYWEDGSFGTSKSGGPRFETAPDGSREFKTAKKQPQDANQNVPSNIWVQPEINVNPPMPRPTPPRPRPNPPKPAP